MTVPRAAVLEPAREVPREITEPCTACVGGVKHRPNPEWHRQRRLRAKIKLTEMARIISLHRKVSVQYLSQIERGEKVFPQWAAELYERMFLRYTRAADES